MKSLLLAIAAVVAVSTPAAADNCLAVSVVNGHRTTQGHNIVQGHNAAQAVVVVPQANFMPVMPFANATHISTQQSHAAALSLAQQAYAIPVVANQILVTPSHVIAQHFIAQQAHCFGVRQQAVVVEQRIRRERRGLGRLLFGR